MSASKINCIYLIQAAGSLPEIYKDLRNKDFVLLSYKDKTKDTNIFMPNSTWTTGRNALREFALKLETQYDYYIFLDDDAEFLDKKTFDDFEFLLDFHKPYIGNPAYPGYGYTLVGKTISTTFAFDGICNAFSKEAFASKEIFPYVDKFDETNWWASQYCMMCACLIKNKEVCVFHDIHIVNTEHRPYPKNRDFSSIQAYMLNLYKLKNLPNFKPTQRKQK